MGSVQNLNESGRHKANRKSKGRRAKHSPSQFKQNKQNKRFDRSIDSTARRPWGGAESCTCLLQLGPSVEIILDGIGEGRRVLSVLKPVTDAALPVFGSKLKRGNFSKRYRRIWTTNALAVDSGSFDSFTPAPLLRRLITIIGDDTVAAEVQPSGFSQGIASSSILH